MSSAANSQAAKVASRQQAERENRGQRWRAKDREGVTPSHRQPALAPAAHFVEADCDERPNEREAGGKRERELERVPNEAIAKSAIPATA